MVQPLTKRQRQIFEFIADHIRDNHYAPSLEEIGQRFELSSLATVHKHLTNLQAKGYIVRRWNRSRAMELRWQSDCCPTCGQHLPVAERAELATAI